MGNYKIIPYLLLLFLSACQRDIPVPESSLDSKSNSVNEAMEHFPVTGKLIDSPFFVRHHVKGNSVFVECKLPDISFRNDHHNKKSGKLVVYVDNRKIEEINSPVLIIKNLSSGNHKITLEVVDKQNQPYQLKKELNVTIP